MVQVEISQGILEGELRNNEFGGTFFSFKGIPYAEPPLDDLRFQAPLPPQPWTGIRSAKKHAPICYQKDTLLKIGAISSEDCLYLNVYTPNILPSILLPVMIFIHGGSFESGSGNDEIYGPDFLVKNGVILVTINYRLGALGFLSLQSNDIPGNAGMKDQVAAIKWVKNNIKHFGGDPDNITIFGESAGAASVSFHLISPLTKGLFKRAIIQSGSANCWWAQAFEPRERAKALASKLGLDSDNDTEIYHFLKSQPAEALITKPNPVILSEVQSKINIEYNIVNESHFDGVERFFYGDVLDSLRKGIHENVDVITGFVEHEGLIAASINGFENILSNAKDYVQSFVPTAISFNSSVKTQLEIGQKVKQYYLNDKKITNETWEEIVKFISSDMFVFDIVQWEKIIARHNKNNKLYFYKFTCKSERNLWSRLTGIDTFIKDKEVVSHGDDLPYLFPFKIFGLKVDHNSKSYRMIEQVVQLWTNFAKYGHPTPDGSLGTQWPQYSIEEQCYLDIGEQLTIGVAPDGDEIQFWEDIFRQYYPKAIAG